MLEMVATSVGLGRGACHIGGSDPPLVQTYVAFGENALRLLENSGHYTSCH